MKIQIEIIGFPSRCILYSALAPRHSGNRVDQLTVGNLAVAIEAQPFALAPRRVVPARHQREIFLALAHGEFSRRDGGEGVAQLVVERDGFAFVYLKSEALGSAPRAFANEPHLDGVVS